MNDEEDLLRVSIVVGSSNINMSIGKDDKELAQTAIDWLQRRLDKYFEEDVPNE